MENIIYQDRCNQYRLCIEVCPCNIIQTNPGGNTTFIPERFSICLKCGQCMAVCNTKAIQIDGLKYDEDLINLPANEVDYSMFIDLLANRRSIRNFRNKPVASNVIQQIIESISYAPFGAEPEKVSLTVISSLNTIESALLFIEKFLDNIVKWVENPVASFMIRQRKGIETFNTIKNHLYPMAKLENYKLKFGDRITRNAPAMVIFHARTDAEEHTNNSIIYSIYFMLAAHTFGLGATMVGIVPAAINKVKMVRDIFQIPRENEAVMSVIFGYPKYKYKRAIKQKIRTLTGLNNERLCSNILFSQWQ